MWVLLYLAIVIQRSLAGTGGNLIIGEPTVDCKEEEIAFTISTVLPFTGTIYVQDQHDKPACHHTYHGNSFNRTTFTIPLGQCGMRRNREFLTKNREKSYGVSYSLVIVTTFHPKVITKWDRSFDVKCSYHPRDKQVDAQIDVSGIEPELLQEESSVFPNCHYSIRDGSADGPIVRDAQIGSTLFHRWECSNPRYAILVKNCVVTDGSGQTIQVIDDKGCPFEGSFSIINPLTYHQSLNFAYTTMEAFNFPDKNKLIFRCQISVCDKHEYQCELFSPPSCSAYPRGYGRGNAFPGIEPYPVEAFVEGETEVNSIEPRLVFQYLQPLIHDNRLVIQKDQDSIDDKNLNRIDDDAIENDVMSKAISPISNEISEIASTPVPNATETTTTQTATTASLPTLKILDKRDSLFPTLSPERKLREDIQRRLADQVMDIESDPVYIRSLFDGKPTSDAMTASSTAALTCLNQTALVTMASAFALTTLLSLIFITYLWKDLFRTCGRSTEERCAQSTSSNISETGSNTAPVYIRRLGNPNYILPFRQFN